MKIIILFEVVLSLFSLVTFAQQTSSQHVSTNKYSALQAQKDIRDGNAHLYIYNGEAPFVDIKAENRFYKKYKVKLSVFMSDVIDFSIDSLSVYNRVVMKYLDCKYGCRWRKKVHRTDIDGFVEWVNEHPCEK